MAKNTAVSVIIPVWGVQYTVAECLESVLAQDMKDIEVICVDDKSPDRSREIVERYAATDPRIQIVEHEENQGLGPARNTGVTVSRGEYFVFLDSDDRFSSASAVGSLLRAAVDSGSELTAGSAVYWDAGGKITPYDRAWDRRYGDRVQSNLTGAAAYAALIRLPRANYLPLRSWGYLFNAAFYTDLGILHPAGAHEDIGHNALVAAMADNVHYCRDIVVDYRIRPGSISNSGWSTAKMDSYLGVWRHFRDHHEHLGLGPMLGNAALHVIRNCCWMLRKNGIEPGHEPALVERIGSVIEEVDDRADPEMIDFVVRLLGEVLSECKLPPGTLAQMLARMPAGSQAAGAYYGLGLRRHWQIAAARP